MRRRLFFAINFEPQAIAAVRNFERDIEGKFSWETADQVRFVSEDNWHLTVLFLGEEDDAQLTGIMRAAKETVRHFSAPQIVFENIAYAPRKDAPKMIWLATDEATSGTVGNLATFLKDELVKERVPFDGDRRPFAGHVTLARFSGALAPERLPAIERPVRATSISPSLDLMESEPGRNGAVYTVLQRFSFSPKTDTMKAL